MFTQFIDAHVCLIFYDLVALVTIAISCKLQNFLIDLVALITHINLIHNYILFRILRLLLNHPSHIFELLILILHKVIVILVENFFPVIFSCLIFWRASQVNFDLSYLCFLLSDFWWFAWDEYLNVHIYLFLLKDIFPHLFSLLIPLKF